MKFYFNLHNIKRTDIEIKFCCDNIFKMICNGSIRITEELEIGNNYEKFLFCPFCREKITGMERKSSKDRRIKIKEEAQAQEDRWNSMTPEERKEVEKEQTDFTKRFKGTS